MQGAIQGYGNSMGSFASIFGLVLGGILFESITVTVFSIGAGIFVLIFILVILNYFNTKKSTVEQKFSVGKV